MNRDRLEGNWRQFRGHVIEIWGRATDDDLKVASGRFEILHGKLQERYGILWDSAETQLDALVKAAKRLGTE